MNNNNDHQELMVLAIELGDNEKKYLKIYNDSKPEELAYEFCSQNNLDYDSLQELTEEIRRAFNSTKVINNNVNLNMQKFNNQNNNDNIEYNEIIQNINNNYNQQNQKITFNENSPIEIHDLDSNDNLNNNNNNYFMTFKQTNPLNNFNIENNNLDNLNDLNNTSQNFENNNSNNKDISNKSNYSNNFKETPNHKNNQFANLNKNQKLYMSDVTNSNSSYNQKKKINNSNKRPSKHFLTPTYASSNKKIPKNKNNSQNINNYNNNNDLSKSQNNFSKSYMTGFSNNDNYILNYGERLYHKGLKLQEKTNEKLEKIKDDREKENKKNCTFKPKINQIPYQAMTNRYNNKLTYNDEDNIIYYKDYKDSKLDILREKYQKIENYSFAPKINNRSTIIDRKKNQRPQTPRFEQLYNNYKKQQLDIQNLTNQVYNPDKFFNPKINNYNCAYTNINFQDRQKVYESKSQEKKKFLKDQIENPIDTQTGQKFFSPMINNDNNIREPFVTFKNLYNDAQKTQKKNEKLAQLIQNSECPFSENYTNNESNEIFQKKKLNAFSKIFNKLDKDQDGLITKLNVETKNLPTKIVKIIEPIVNELKEENETLNENEFKTACDRLYDMLTYMEKREIIEYGNEDIINEKKKKKGKKEEFSFHPKINKNYRTNYYYSMRYDDRKTKKKEKNKNLSNNINNNNNNKNIENKEEEKQQILYKDSGDDEENNLNDDVKNKEIDEDSGNEEENVVVVKNNK